MQTKRIAVHLMPVLDPGIVATAFICSTVRRTTEELLMVLVMFVPLTVGEYWMMREAPATMCQNCC